MSATRPQLDEAVRQATPEDATPVCIDADDLESTAPEYLRDLKYEFAREGYVPARVTAAARFEESGTLAAQAEADEVREVVRAAAFLGAGTVELSVERVADEATVEDALAACTERARREGVTLVVDGPVEV